MALPSTDEEWLTYLSLRHDAEIPHLEELNRYYEGKQPLSYMHPEIFREVQDRIQPVIIAWPQLIVDTIEERLDVEGFRLPDAEAADADLMRVWQHNDMDEQSQLAHVDALVMRRSYVTVGTNETDRDTPLLAAESPLEMFADIDPRTRTMRAALRRVADEDSLVRIAERYATLYLPNRTVWFEYAKNGWVVVNRDEHNLGAVPAVSVVNRGRLSTPKAINSRGFVRGRYGMSELSPIIPLSNAANKVATDMMVAAEFLALPVRGFLGVGPEDLEDADGNTLTAVQTLMKKFLTIPSDPSGESGAREFSFAGANLNGFHESINSLAQLVASLAGLPPHYLGLTTDNPASADAIRSAESRLVKRCERKQRAWGGSYEQMCRIVRRFQEGDWNPDLRRLETIWRDPATPTISQKADAAVKKYESGIVPLKQTREDLGYTDTQITLMEEADEAAAERAARLDPIGEIARGMSDSGVTRDGA